MTTTPNADEPRITVTLTLDRLDTLAQFTTYLRAEPADAGAEGFGIEGATAIVRRIDRDAWEALGRPVVLAITLHAVSIASVTP